MLTPQQVGTGYTMHMLPQGNLVKNQVSLDLCDFRFASERLRTHRLQMAYLHAGRVPQVSNEVVSYKPGGARHALGELAGAYASCPAHPTVGPVQGAAPTRHRLIRVVVPHLSAPYLAVVDRATATIQGKWRAWTGVAIYQIRGNVLSAVYTDGTGSVKAQLVVAFHAALQSADNLRRTAP